MICTLSFLTIISGAYAFKFMSIGDWGGYSTLVPAQNTVAAQLDHIAGASGAAFIVNTGDNFYHCGLVSDNQFINVFQNRYRSDTHPHLASLPWYSVLGNHDYGVCGSPARQIAWTGREPRWHMPDYHFSVPIDDPDTSAVFYFFDSNVFNSVAHSIPSNCGGTPPESGGEGTAGNCYDGNKKQAPGGKATFLWLKNEMALAGSARMKIVVMHHPLPQLDTCEYGKKLVNLLVQYKVDAVISGHFHYKAHYTYKGLHGYISGGGCDDGSQRSTSWCSGGCQIKDGLGTESLGVMMHNIAGNAITTYSYGSTGGHPLFKEKHHRTSGLIATANTSASVV